MTGVTKSRDPNVAADKDPLSRCDTIMVPMPRADVEREILADVLAMRDERNLAALCPEDRKLFTEEAIGSVARLSTEEIVFEAVALGGGGSFSNGFWCKGLPGFSQGVTCKIIKKK